VKIRSCAATVNLKRCFRKARSPKQEQQNPRILLRAQERINFWQCLPIFILYFRVQLRIQPSAEASFAEVLPF